MDKVYLMFGEDVCTNYLDECDLGKIHDGYFDYFTLLEFDPVTMGIHDVLACHDGYTASCEINRSDYEYLTNSDYAITYKKQ